MYRIPNRRDSRFRGNDEQQQPQQTTAKQKAPTEAGAFAFNDVPLSTMLQKAPQPIRT
jgi:hypothetical protein